MQIFPWSIFGPWEALLRKEMLVALTREQKVVLALDTALTSKRDELTTWEINFLNGLRSAYIKRSSLSVKQKSTVSPILKRIGLTLS